LKNILSIDLESWFYALDVALGENKASSVSSHRKDADDNYMPDATEYILNFLDRFSQKATFFITAELYDWYPEIIEEIEVRGHEIGYHTHSHKIIYNKDILEEELRQSSEFLERFRPEGFRAPHMFISRDSFAILKRYGFRYSSSTYGIYRIFNIDGIDEIPVSAYPFRKVKGDDLTLPGNINLKMLLKQIPFGSGLFIAIFGASISRFIDAVNKKDIPAILLFHPWQIYRHKEITGLNFKIKTLFHNPLFLPYTFNIKKSLESLFSQYRFISFRQYYNLT